MTAVDTPTAQQPTAAPAPTQGPAPAGRYIGRHRADKDEPRHTRHVIAASEQVPADYWPPSVRRRPADAVTAVIPAVQADTAAVLAELRDDLTHTDDTRKEQA